MKVIAVAVAALVLASGCSVEKGPDGGEGHPGLVTGAAATAYAGPLVVRRGRFGAAGQVVDCRHGIRHGGSSPAGQETETFVSPATALEKQIVMGLGTWPDTGYRIGRQTSQRFLYTWSNGKRDVLAVITRFGRGNMDKEGWYVESWAQCDPADFPDATAVEMGYEVWSDRTGRVSTERISASTGPEHCDWQEATILHVGGATYWRNPPADLGEHFDTPYAEGMKLPDDAQPTRYFRKRSRLWLSADGRVAYVGTVQAVDRWVTPRRRLMCA